MTKNVMVSIQGIHSLTADDCGLVQDTAKGEYFFRNGKHYILYRQMEEGFAQEVRSRIKFAEDCVEVTRKGPIRAYMVFEKGKERAGSYDTPYGNIPMGIDTYSMDINVSDEQITVDIEYGLELDGGKVSDCRIHIKITPQAEEA